MNLHVTGLMCAYFCPR